MGFLQNETRPGKGAADNGRDGRLSRKALENRVNGSPTPNESFYWPNWTYDSLGNVTTFSYPQCTHAACTATSPRAVQNSYAVGGLTQVGFPGSTGAYASSITYHPNGMVNQVVHANTPSFPSTWLTDTYALDPFGMNRPASVTTTSSGGVQRWATGAYGYDGAGNIKSMGTHTFAYDKVSRLTAANLYLEPTSSTSLRFQTFSYDAFGNLQSIAGTSARSTPTSASTNRLTAATYDAQGNVTTWNGNQYEYDPFNLMWHYKTATAGDEWVYLYTAADERVWSYKVDNTSLWTLREPGGSVLREYTTNGTWIVQSDYIYRDGALLAAETASGLRHFHLDHLGTPRLVTNSTGLQAAYHVYYPYGEEATAFNQDTIRAKFTGHERDLGNLGGSGDDLDYMHARFCSPLIGRFWGVDQGVESISPAAPQTWNRYAYSLGNPIKYYDPDGSAINLVAAAGGAAIGALAGGIGSIAAQLYSNGGNVRAINWRDVGASAAGGGASGGLAGLTLGTSLLVEGGAAAVIAVGAGSNAIGGAVTRKLDSSSATQPGDVEEIGIDLVAGAAGGGVGLKVESIVTARVPQLQQQAASSMRAAQRGSYAASQSVKGHLAKAAAARTNGEILANVAGAKVTNVVVPVARAAADKKKKSSPSGS